MEVPIAIAAAAWGLSQIVNASEPVVATSTNPVDEYEDMWEYEANVRGMPAPPVGASSTLLPFKKGDHSPYFVHRPGDSPMDATVTNIHRQLQNAKWMDRQDWELAMKSHRPQQPRTRAQPVFTGFTDELVLYTDQGERLSTGFINFSWLPSNPTDSDYNDAAVLAKAAPPDPLLFTPDANFATAPGVSWRYAF